MANESKLVKDHDFIVELIKGGYNNAYIARALKVSKSTFNDYVAKHELRLNDKVVKVKDNKVLILDIETKPAKAYVWGAWQQNVMPPMIIEEKAVISVAAKWRGSRDVMFYSDNNVGHEAMIWHVWNLLNEATVVVHYNGYKFDMPHLNQEFLLAGYPPPEYYQVDLLKTMRTEFNFLHNKLDNVAKQLDIGHKIEHEGFALWDKCMRGEAKAWAKMKKYNVHDVKLTEELFEYLLPWLKGPNLPKKRLWDHKKIGGLF